MTDPETLRAVCIFALAIVTLGAAMLYVGTQTPPRKE